MVTIDLCTVFFLYCRLQNGNVCVVKVKYPVPCFSKVTVCVDMYVFYHLFIADVVCFDAVRARFTNAS